ncbi:putative coil containing protein [Vibrio phage 191E37-1]|nr:putative coil containing protein [Vibrio phage 191E37-1]
MKNNELLELKKLLDEFSVMLFNPSTTNDALVGRLSDINDSISYMLTPRTKVRLKPASYNAVSDAIAAHESGVKFVRLLPNGTTEDLSWFALCRCYANGYKIMVVEESEIDERQEFIDECQKHGSWEAMYDSGKFKLVEK